jgi:predicted RNase H-like nuclease
MMWIVGVDGCKRGWVAVWKRLNTHRLHLSIHDSASGFIEGKLPIAVVAIDIPIGLSEKGPRECDKIARALLGWPRQSSVFSPPIRAALQGKSREEASEITQAADGRRVAAQAWAIYRKVAEVDNLLRQNPRLQDRMHEVHPEVSFLAMNGGCALVAGKRTDEGRAQRKELIARWIGMGAVDALFQTARSEMNLTKRDVADDDLLDAAAALWTAERIHRRASRTLPPNPPLDAVGLRMEIVF